jgi:L-fuculose-phosphate aldolase
MSDERASRLELAAAYKNLAAEKLLFLSSGNLSIRLHERILITPTGTDASVEPADLVLIDFEGRAEREGFHRVNGPCTRRSTKRDPTQRRSCIPTATPARPLLVIASPLPAFHYMIASFGGAEVPCADYAPFGSKALAKSAAAALVRHNACLVANHGMICFGSDIRSAAIQALKLEMLARQYILAKQLGEPYLLSETEVAEAARRYAFYGVGYIPEAQ